MFNIYLAGVVSVCAFNNLCAGRIALGMFCTAIALLNIVVGVSL